MKVVLWGTYDTGKPRVRLLRQGIQQAGFELIECHQDIWGGIEDKSQLKGLVSKFVLLLGWLGAYPKLIWRYLHLPPHDVVLVSYPGLLDVLIIRVFAWLRKVPVIWDVFISAYDTVVEDRRMLSPNHPFSWLLYVFEWLAVRAADCIFMDTNTHAKRIELLFNLPDGVCGSVWVGAEADKFPRIEDDLPVEASQAFDRPLQILFYGQFIPLHGINYIVEAARILRDENMNWTLIGKGQEAQRIKEMLEEEPLPLLNWIEWVDYSELVGWIRKADICLGIFGTSKKATSVIPNKVFQIVASGKPIITQDSPAIRELLSHNPPCIYLVQAGSANDLVSAIREHMEQIKHNQFPVCHKALINQINVDAIGAQFNKLLTSKISFGEKK
ncbi:MAG: glycosyltransferase [Methylococcales bacterium]|nr:glycosyltransferase [Methylococcales bacterium]